MDILRIPTVEYCEKVVQGLIARPGYAISNIPFILAGSFIILKNKGSRFSFLVGILSIIIGVCSFLYDASFTFLSQYFDWLGMFLFILFLSILNLKRLFDLDWKRLITIFSLILFLYLPVSFLTEQGTFFFGIGVVFLILSEIYLTVKNKSHLDKKWVLALMLFLIGYISRNLDLYGVFCDPGNILNGRGIFHYLSSISILLLHSYYKKILH